MVLEEVDVLPGELGLAGTAEAVQHQWRVRVCEQFVAHPVEQDLPTGEVRVAVGQAADDPIGRRRRGYARVPAEGWPRTDGGGDRRGGRPDRGRVRERRRATDARHADGRVGVVGPVVGVSRPGLPGSEPQLQQVVGEHANVMLPCRLFGEHDDDGVHFRPRRNSRAPQDRADRLV